MAKHNMSVVPVVKWAGGKRQLIPEIRAMMPKFYNRYYEPFLGGAALFCELAPQTAVVNDSNRQLINMYQQIQSNPFDVCNILQVMQDEYNAYDTQEQKNSFYYERRDQFNSLIDSTGDGALSAALLIFLNKAGFNGLYRVNSAGRFNVPPAHRKIIKAYEAENVANMSKLLQNAEILCGDFESACASACANDFVFFDSPYYDTFDTYQAGGFSEVDHHRLFQLFDALSKRGVYCMLTNNNCDFIKDLYKNYPVRIVDVKRMINCDGKNRVGKEVIVTSYATTGGI